MLKGFKKNRDDRIGLENIASRYIIGFMSLIILWQTYILGARVTDQKTVFVPPKLATQEFWVSGQQVSTNYLSNMAEFIVFNLFNVTPENARANGGELLALVEPQFYGEVDRIVKTQLAYLTENQISRSLFIGKTDVSKPGNIVVEGLLREFIGDKLVSKQNVTITITYGIVQSRFWLRGIKAETKGGSV